MARYIGPKHRLSRRLGVNIFGKESASLERRLNVPPGEHGHKRRRRLSEYALRWREKQRVRFTYGLVERQLRNLFEEALHEPGPTGENLLRLLERRLDNVVYRLGLARTRPMARQMVVHGHVRINGRRVDSPSYRVRAGETIEVDAPALAMPAVQEALHEGRPVPGWLEREDSRGRVLRPPSRDEIDREIREQWIVEFYSR